MIPIFHLTDMSDGPTERTTDRPKVIANVCNPYKVHKKESDIQGVLSFAIAQTKNLEKYSLRENTEYATDVYKY